MAVILRVIFSVLVIGALQAKDLGFHGSSYPVAETSLIKVLEKRASAIQKEDLDQLQGKVRKRYTSLLEEPYPVPRLTESLVEKISYFDPTYICHESILDPKGEIIVAKGTRFNPLKQITPTKKLLFLDGSKASHVSWARRQGEETIWMLVKGRPLDLEEKEGRPIYFDQFGQAVKKFNISHIPAIVSPEGLRVKIRVVPLHEVET